MTQPACHCGNPPAYWVRAAGVEWVIPVCWRCALTTALSKLVWRETEAREEPCD